MGYGYTYTYRRAADYIGYFGDTFPAGSMATVNGYGPGASAADVIRASIAANGNVVPGSVTVNHAHRTVGTIWEDRPGIELPPCIVQTALEAA